MPEGHTIHRIAKDHQRDFVGQNLDVTSPQGRFSKGAAKLNGRLLEATEAHGKHLCYLWEGGQRLHIHLGLYGKFRRHRQPVPEPRGQVRLRVIGESLAFDLNGPNACELLSQKDWKALQSRLGADPLRDDANPDDVWATVSKSRMAIGGILLNQKVIAGVGNVYRAEILHLCNIHPERPGKSLSRSEFQQVWDTTVELLKIGVRYNRIIIARPDEIGKPRSRMNREERLLVYKKEICSRCDGPVKSWLLGGRKIFACDRCQPT